MFIRSERLFLRPGWPEDWDEFETLIGDDDVVRSLSRLPWTIAAADVRPAMQASPHRLLPYFMITLPTSRGARLIGTIGLGQAGDEVSVGFWIAREHRGKGYAAEALRAVVAQARALGHRRLVATHYADNPQARGVLEHAGFRVDGASGEGGIYAVTLDCAGPVSDPDLDGAGGGSGAVAA